MNEIGLYALIPANEIWEISSNYNRNRTIKLAPIGVSFS